MGEATTFQDHDAHRVLSAASALASGEIQQLADGRAAYVEGLKAVAIGDVYNLRKVGAVRIVCAAATTFSEGDEVWWDTSANLAVAAATATDPADFRLGIADQDSGSSQAWVETDLNATAPGIGSPIESIRYEFDCQTLIDATAHVLVPAVQNPSGLIVTHIFARVTEVFAGDSEDQGIVTVSDESNNALATLTATNASADALKDKIVGYQGQAASTGDALLVVAAGEFIDAIVTQFTSGANVAGKMVVYIEAIRL